ncbi:hypothetical protein PHYBOEH_010868 [Phytophthora boehmeriae]|uniref:Uncharacterized protein n=1 Tax=Phytophthora boehmeriae TaxID=109152 RepID=A0A8T1VJZ7_9STRA|nr:hypothetical protein PHYBOEH_010868 [Phytophthora boehmeriae]
MPLGDLIPIGGAPSSSNTSKRSASNDLTGGLISISGARGNVDVDMSDFDVGDLLGDDSSKSKSKAKDKSDDPFSKKKKSKDKSKSSSSSKKKSKSKSKKSAFDDDDDFGDTTDDWAPSSKNWDSAADLELAAAAAARKKNKPGGGLDDEFAKMLGLDSGGADLGAGTNFESPSLSPDLNRGDNADKFDTNDDFEISEYKPTVRGSKKLEHDEDKSTFHVDESANKDDGGVSASFFQDDDGGVQNSSSLSSMFGSTTERRGGPRGGRRQAGSAEEDPFGLGSTAKATGSGFDSLFGGASSRRSNLDDLFGSTTKRAPETSEVSPQEPEVPNEEREIRTMPSMRSTAAPAEQLSAKDDLLADLFSAEPSSASRNDRREQQEHVKMSAQGEAASESNVKEETQPARPALPVAADPSKQQDDLLAELFATPPVYKTPARVEQEEEQKPSPTVAKAQSSTAPPPLESVDPAGKTLEPSTSSSVTNANTTSAKDSLLMDLLGDLSPPKSSEPQTSRRRGRNNSNNPSPEKELTRVEDPFKRSTSSSAEQSKPLSTAPETLAEVSANLSAASPILKPDTPPSPGQRRTLALSTGALAIRERDFEQSKDSLLEEILSSPGSAASPDARSRQSSPHRRGSYSQSFEADDGLDNIAEEQTEKVIEEEEPSAEHPQYGEPPSTAAPVIEASPPQSPSPPPLAAVKTESKSKEKAARKSMADPPQIQTQKHEHQPVPQKVYVPACNCAEREEAFTAAFDIERAALQNTIDELTNRLEMQTAFNNHTMQQLEERETSNNQLRLQLEAQEISNNQLSQRLEERLAANAQLAQELAKAQNDKLQAQQLAATSKDDAASYQHRAELLEAQMRDVREELSRSKRAVQDAELALAKKTAEYDEVDQLERHREKRALEALSAQLQRALARLAISQQVQEEGPGYDTSAARAAAEDEARLRVIASLEGSSKRAAQHAEQERAKLAELLRDLEAGARNARQGALEDKERLRQEQQRLDALSAHLQAQTTALRDQEAAHAAYMGQQLAEAREDARVYEARLATRRTQLERDERALYEARAEFAAYREQITLEIEREHEELRASRLMLENAWRELRADREDLEAELASHEEEFQALENLREEVQHAEARLAERSEEVVALAEKLDVGTQELLAREQIVAQQAAAVQDCISKSASLTVREEDSLSSDGSTSS